MNAVEDGGLSQQNTHRGKHHELGARLVAQLASNEID